MPIEYGIARPDERDAVLRLREEVFCDEQGVPLALERDGRDGEAVHCVARDGGRIDGTCRLLFEGGVWRLGRMAVRRARRGDGVGIGLLAEAHRTVLAAGGDRIALHAQVPVIGFYARAGYRLASPRFTDAGIAHALMVCDDPASLLDRAGPGGPRL